MRALHISHTAKVLNCTVSVPVVALDGGGRAGLGGVAGGAQRGEQKKRKSFPKNEKNLIRKAEEQRRASGKQRDDETQAEELHG